MLWESLTIPQKRFLKGLAAEAAGVKVFGGEFVSRYGLGSPSNAQRVVEALLAKDVIDRDDGSFPDHRTGFSGCGYNTEQIV